MKIFVDTGSIKDIETIAQLGILDGVTTNPSLLAKESGDYRENLKRICDIVKGPVSGEVTATDFAGMMREGHDIAKLHQYMGQDPLNPTAFAPARRCRAKGSTSTSHSASRPRKRCSPRRPAPAISAHSSAVSTTSQPTAWN